MDYKQKLIKEVKEHGILYKKSHSGHQDIIAKNRVWEKIAEKLDLTVKDCRTAWKSLRDQYSRSVRENIRSTGQKNNLKKQYKYFEQLQFLNKYLKKRRSKNVIPDEDTHDIEEVLLEVPSLCSSSANEMFAPETSPDDHFKMVTDISETDDSIVYCPSPSTSKKTKFVDDDSLFSTNSSVKNKPTADVDTFTQIFTKLMEHSKEEKYDDMDRFFLLLSSLVKKYNLSLSEQMNIQCRIMTFVKDELEKIKTCT